MLNEWKKKLMNFNNNKKACWIRFLVGPLSKKAWHETGYSETKRRMNGHDQAALKTQVRSHSNSNDCETSINMWNNRTPQSQMRKGGSCNVSKLWNGFSLIFWWYQGLQHTKNDSWVFLRHKYRTPSKVFAEYY
jgi:hypothetical protein